MHGLLLMFTYIFLSPLLIFVLLYSDSRNSTRDKCFTILYHTTGFQHRWAHLLKEHISVSYLPKTKGSCHFPLVPCPFAIERPIKWILDSVEIRIFFGISFYCRRIPGGKRTRNSERIPELPYIEINSWTRKHGRGHGNMDEDMATWTRTW